MPVNITVELVQQLMEQNASLLKQNEQLTATVRELNRPSRNLRSNLIKTPRTVQSHLQAMDLRSHQ